MDTFYTVFAKPCPIINISSLKDCGHFQEHITHKKTQQKLTQDKILTVLQLKYFSWN